MWGSAACSEFSRTAIRPRPGGQLEEAAAESKPHLLTHPGLLEWLPGGRERPRGDSPGRPGACAGGARSVHPAGVLKFQESSHCLG